MPVNKLARTLLSFKRPTRRNRTATVRIITIVGNFRLGARVMPVASSDRVLNRMS